MKLVERGRIVKEVGHKGDLSDSDAVLLLMVPPMSMQYSNTFSGEQNRLRRFLVAIVSARKDQDGRFRRRRGRRC